MGPHPVKLGQRGTSVGVIGYKCDSYSGAFARKPGYCNAFSRRKIAQTNQDSVVTLFGYDGAGRLTSVTNAYGTADQIVTRYDYDEAGNEVHQIDALNRTNVYVYDGMGRRVVHYMPTNGLSESFGFDLAGNLLYQRPP